MPRPGPIVFFGTPAFAVPTLEAMAAAGLAPDLVVTQPSRPSGRGRRVELPPVGKWAEEREVELAQIQRVRDPEFLEDLAGREPWVGVVVAFGQIFPQTLLDVPRAGCVNLHASLLPRHRGAAPVQAALVAGDEVTGVCVMRMEKGLDTGPVYACRETRIEPGETADALGHRLALLGGELMARTLAAIAAGDAVATPQDDALATWAPRIEKADGRVDWGWSARELVNRYRGYTPWPGLTASLDGRPVKLLDVVVAASDPESGTGAGAFHGLGGAGALVECGDGSLVAIGRLQRPGRRALTAVEFVNGERLAPGTRFDSAPGAGGGTGR